MRSTTLILCLFIAGASHADLSIFDVQRNLPMADGEKIFHDYYVDGGTEAGLKTGMIVTVVRKQPLFDHYRNREVADLLFKVAKVKVIQAQEGLAVVRVKDETSREDAPISDEPYVMIGDRLDVANSVADNAPASPDAVAAAPVVPVDGAPAARIVVNSVELTIDEPKKAERAPAGAPKTAVK